MSHDTGPEPLRLKTVLGNHAHVRPLKEGRVATPGIVLDLIEYQPVHEAFAIMVNKLEFDVCEMAIATFLQARDAGIPLTLLPVGMIGRFQHRYLVGSADRGLLRPDDLAGRRIGVRSYSVTTGMWVRGLLEEQYGVDPSSVTWHTYEASHLAGYENPANVVVAPEGRSIVGDVADGVTDAAIVGADDPALRPLIEDPDAAARAWFETHRAVPINHLVAVRSDLLRERPELGPELVRYFQESRELAGPVQEEELVRELGAESAPIGVEALLPAVEIAADLCHRQGITTGTIDPTTIFEVAS